MGILVAQTTKRALEASLKKLLLRKPLNKITINDITEDCGVNRMTFYYHFQRYLRLGGLDPGGGCHRGTGRPSGL